VDGIFEYFLVFFIWVFFSTTFVFLYREGKEVIYGMCMVLFSLIVFICWIVFSFLTVFAIIEINGACVYS